MKMKQLPYLKGYPEQILPTIEFFAKYQDKPYLERKKGIEKYLYPKLLEIRKSRKGVRGGVATIESLVYNQAIPTCYTLGLVFKEGRPKKTRLKPTGWALLKAFEKQGEDYYLKKLGKVLINFSKNNGKIIETIERIRKRPGDFVSIVSLVIALHKIGVKAGEKIKNPSLVEKKELEKNGIDYSAGSRLSDLLKYYQFSNMIMRNGNQIYLNSPWIKDIEKEDVLTSVNKIADEKFFSVLYTAYKSETRSGRGYVPIWPHIRDYVCKELEISHVDFVRKLTSLPATIKGRQIHLAHAGIGRPKYQLTRFGKGFYYYISIFNRGEG
ncbi:hypothetical protein ES703_03430 [subsurface metagenome]